MKSIKKLLNWKIKGFYDGKILLYDKNIIPSECIFLDIEIFRKNFKSLGQHMIVPNNKIYYEYGDNALENCISPNNLRKYDANKNFRLKFPLASIHFLISILYKEDGQLMSLG